MGDLYNDHILPTAKLIEEWDRAGKKLHYCEAPRTAKEYNYGVAIYKCTELKDGTLMVDNDEYGSQVDYCPYCGYEAKNKIEKHYTAYLKRQDRLTEQKTITLTEEELNKIIDGQAVRGYTQKDIEMVVKNK